MKRFKEITTTTLVLEALVRADDFRTARQLVIETGCASNQVSAALYHLLKHRAVDLIEMPDALWWFATLTSDTRSYTVEEKTPESRPRRPRKNSKRGPRRHYPRRRP